MPRKLAPIAKEPKEPHKPTWLENRWENIKWWLKAQAVPVTLCSAMGFGGVGLLVYILKQNIGTAITLGFFSTVGIFVLFNVLANDDGADGWM